MVAAALVVVVVGGWTVVGVLFERTDTATTVLPGPVTALVLEVDAGDVLLVAGDDDDLVVERTSNYTIRGPGLTAEVVDGVASVTATCASPSLRGCSVEHRITVPTGVRIEIDVADGGVRLAGLDGWVSVVAGGAVEGTDLVGAEVLVATSGSPVVLAFAAPPSRVDVTSDGGAVTLALPGGPYALTAETDGGAVTADVPTDTFAERLLRVATGGGPVVLERG